MIIQTASRTYRVVIDPSKGPTIERKNNDHRIGSPEWRRISHHSPEYLLALNAYYAGAPEVV